MQMQMQVFLQPFPDVGQAKGFQGYQYGPLYCIVRFVADPCILLWSSRNALRRARRESRIGKMASPFSIWLATRQPHHSLNFTLHLQIRSFPSDSLNPLPHDATCTTCTWPVRKCKCKCICFTLPTETTDRFPHCNLQATSYHFTLSRTNIKTPTSRFQAFFHSLSLWKMLPILFYFLFLRFSYASSIFARLPGALKLWGPTLEADLTHLHASSLQ